MGQLYVKRLSDLIFPVFAKLSIVSNINKPNKVYSCVPTDVVSLMGEYFDCHLEDADDFKFIDRIVNIKEYMMNRSAWASTFITQLGESFKHISEPVAMDFNGGYVTIEYNREDLERLFASNNFDPELLKQLDDMAQWVTATKMHRKVLNDMDKKDKNPFQV